MRIKIQNRNVVLIFVLVFQLISSSIFAQVPQKMSYQAVIRDASRALVTNKPIGMKISIAQGTQSGSIVYTETFKPTTNTNGLVSLEIGGAANFSLINWANGPYFILTEVDIDGGINYTISGYSQLVSVPYALHAKTAESITGSTTIPSGTALPTPVSPTGSFFYKTDTNVLYISNGTAWLPISTDGSTPSGTTFPTATNLGDVFFNTNNKNFYYWDGATWKMASNIPSGTTLPAVASSVVGDPFYKTDTNILYVFNGTSWNPINGLSSTLAEGSFFVGNAANIATPTTKVNIPLSGFGAPTADVSMGNKNITNLATPLIGPDAANKAYVDSQTATTPTGPTNPPVAGAKLGDVFYNTTTKSFYYFDGTDWKLITNTPSGPTLPPTGNTGDTFYNTTTNALYVYNNGTWNSTKVQADWAQNTPTADDYIKNKPTLVSQFINDAGYLTTLSLPTAETDPIWSSVSNNYYTKNNMQTSGAAQLHFNNVTNTPTTLAGYGITDAASANHNHLLDGLSDVTITGKANNDILQWDNVSGKWVNKSLVVQAETDPVVSAINGIVKSDGTKISSAVAGKDYVLPNSAIAGGTKTKITYDSKGLVTAGADATTADIAPSTNRQYVTDNQLTVLNNTSGVNTGDQINISGNAATVTTNANLTGPITSVGNATSIASQTGTGSKFVVDNSPTLITPVIGVATATSINKLTITAPTNSATLTIANLKTLTVPNNASVSGTNTGDQTASQVAVTPTVNPAGNISSTNVQNALEELQGDINLFSAANHPAVSLGTPNGLSMNIQQLSLATASSIAPGALSAADWNTFNNKEDVSNKKTDVTLGGAGSSDIFYPTQNAVKSYVDAQISSATIPDATTSVKGKLKLAGDLGGTADLPSVLKINGAALGSTTATNGNILIANGTTWESKAVSGDITLTNGGVSTIGAGKVTDSKLDKANIPLSGFGLPTTDVSLGTKKITDLAGPILGTDAVNKNYVDNALVNNSVPGRVYQGIVSDVATFNTLDWTSISSGTDKGSSIPSTICSLDLAQYTWVAFPKAWGVQSFFYKYGGSVYSVFDGFEKRIVSNGSVDYQVWVFKTTPNIPVDLIVNN